MTRGRREAHQEGAASTASSRTSAVGNEKVSASNRQRSGAGPAHRTLRAYWTFATLPTTPYWARKLTRDKLAAWKIEHVIDDAQVVVSELLTNAVREINARNVDTTPQEDGSSSVAYTALIKNPSTRLRLEYSGDVLTISVWDPLPVQPIMKVAADSDEAGRGLPLVRGLSDDCGWYWVVGEGGKPGDGGKVVWARLQVQLL